MFKPKRNLIALTFRNFIGFDLSTELSTDAVRVESEMDYFLIFELFRLDFYLNETTKGQRFGVKFQTVCNVKATQIKA